MEHTLRNHGSAVIDTHQLALHYARDHQVDNLLHGNLRLVEKLGYHHHRVVAGTGNAQCQMAGRAAHGRNHKPVLRSACILHHGGANHRTLCLGTVVSESGRAIGQRQVVVNGLGYMDIGNRIVLVGQELGNAVGGRCSVVASHGHQQLNIVVLEEVQVETFLEILVSGFKAAHLQNAAALIENLVGHQEIDILHTWVLGKQRAVAAMQPYHSITVTKKCLGHRGHHCVHSRGRTATGQDCNTFHVVMFLSAVTAPHLRHLESGTVAVAV